MDDPTTGAAMYKSQLPPDPSMLYGEMQPMGGSQAGGGGMPRAQMAQQQAQQGQMQPPPQGQMQQQPQTHQPPQMQHPAQAQHPAQGQSHTQPQPQTQAQSHDQPHPGPHPQSQPQPHARSESHPQSQTQAQPQPGTQSTGSGTNAAGSQSWLPGESLFKPLCDSLAHIVDSSDPGRFAAAQPDQLAPSEIRKDAVHSYTDEAKGWLKHFFPSAQTVDRLFAAEHMGNYVVDRKTGRKLFESMPLYVRVGMHLLFVSAADVMGYRYVEQLLLSQSIRQGQLYDQGGPGALQHIQGFVKAYAIPLEELLEKDLTKYPNFNSFFARRLTANARPIACPDEPGILVCPADCRLSVFQSVDEAKALWIKGKQFTIPKLLYGDDRSDHCFDGVTTVPSAVAVARLAPQDYHRFHTPVSGEIIHVKDIDGDLYTVNPQAVNEDLNVFTLNKRSVMLIHADVGLGASIPVAFVAVGAMLVGSIRWSKKPGDRIVKGEELGWFQYGGSTCIVVIPRSSGVRFDDDLLAVSEQRMESLVQVGMSLGHVGGSPKSPKARSPQPPRSPRTPMRAA